MGDGWQPIGDRMPTVPNFPNNWGERNVIRERQIAAFMSFKETGMSQTLISQPAVHVAPELLERCDSCGAAAKLLATLGTGELVFCGHHANRYADRIVATARQVVIESGFEWRGGT